MAIGPVQLFRLARAGFVLAREGAFSIVAIEDLPPSAAFGVRVARLFERRRVRVEDRGARITAALNRLGPSYVKLGQFLATRADVVGQDETCAEGDKSWACGMRARTAFRAFLRGRAVVCSVPPEGGRDRIAAECRVGNQDVGQWLVENGWARAAAAGPYVEAGDKARTEKKGIFGEAPDMSGLPPAPPETGPAPEAPASILDGNDGALSPPPPVDQPAPVE